MLLWCCRVATGTRRRRRLGSCGKGSRPGEATSRCDAVGPSENDVVASALEPALLTGLAGRAALVAPSLSLLTVLAASPGAMHRRRSVFPLVAVGRTFRGETDRVSVPDTDLLGGPCKWSFGHLLPPIRKARAPLVRGRCGMRQFRGRWSRQIRSCARLVDRT